MIAKRLMDFIEMVVVCVYINKLKLIVGSATRNCALLASRPSAFANRRTVAGAGCPTPDFLVLSYVSYRAHGRAARREPQAAATGPGSDPAQWACSPGAAGRPGVGPDFKPLHAGLFLGACYLRLRPRADHRFCQGLVDFFHPCGDRSKNFCGLLSRRAR